MKKTIPSLLFCIILLSLPMIVIVNAATVTITVNANSAYTRFQQATVSGALSKDGAPVSDGLVAIEIKSPNSNTLTFRTVNTGSNPPNQIATIQSVYLSDLSGNQISIAARGTLAYFKASVTNNDPQTKTVLITLSVYDNYNSPIGSASSTAPIPSHETREIILGIPIPSSASVGIGRVFAGAYSNNPSLGGLPYCIEKSSTFAVDTTQGSPPPDTPAGNQGSYSMPFTVPIDAAIGTHIIYVSSSNNSLTAYASRSFTVSQTGDLNGDGKVTANDITLFVLAYISYWNGQPFDPLADLDHNGAVNINDITLVVYAYIQYWSWQ